jgi:hypothetical protein
MVDENQEQPEEMTNADAQWNAFSELAPEREDIVLPEESDDTVKSVGHKTLSQQMRDSPRLTDAQVFDNRMFPDMGKPWLNRVMSSEIFPDSFNHFFRIFVKGLMKEDRGRPLHEAIADSHTVCSIALGREGRFDQLAHDGTLSQKTEDEKNGGLG